MYEDVMFKQQEANDSTSPIRMTAMSSLLPELCGKKKMNPRERKKLFTSNIWQIRIIKILNC